MTLSELCLRCGLCCDGTLFSHVSVTTEEAADLSRRGLSVEPKPAGAWVLRQPCEALEGTCCRIYSERPSACRALTCLLAAAYQSGEVGAPEALRLVEAAQEKVALLALALGSPARGAPWQARSLGAQGDLTPKARSALEELQAFLERHFLGRQRTLRPR